MDQITRNWCTKRDEVSVTEVETDSTVEYVLRIGDEDVGKVIGHNGQTVTVLRTLVSAITAKEDSKRDMMEIIEDR